MCMLTQNGKSTIIKFEYETQKEKKEKGSEYSKVAVIEMCRLFSGSR